MMPNHRRPKNLTAVKKRQSYFLSMVRHGLILLLVLIAFVMISPGAFCYTAEVTDISGQKYFPAVKEAIEKAQKSINVAMFSIELSLKRQDSKPNQLINALIEAKNRGVEVEVIIDQNVDFVGRRYSGDWETRVKSTRAYQRLKEAGVKAYYDEPARYVHAKTVVIDGKVVILGSTNWTEGSFDNNIETDVLIRSEKLAGEILSYLKTIKIDAKIDDYLEIIGPATPLSWEFLESPKAAPLMVKGQAERAFDVYLYLLWKFDGNPEGRITLFYDTLAQYLGIEKGWLITDYRRQIIKVLRKLEREYKLIKFQPRYAKEAEVTLLSYDDPAKTYEILQDAYFELPNNYFDYGWNRELSLRAKFCLLINLANTDISDIKPYWSKSVITITKEFGGISPDILHKGMGELRRRKLLEVRYDELGGKPYDLRRPKMYKILKLYDPKELEAQMGKLEAKYGKQGYRKARAYAAIVFEENNPAVIEDIILKTKKYGEKKVRGAFAVAAKKNVDNPARVYNYVAGIIENKS